MRESLSHEYIMMHIKTNLRFSQVRNMKASTLAIFFTWTPRRFSLAATPSHHQHKLHATSPGAISYQTLSPHKTIMPLSVRNKENHKLTQLAQAKNHYRSPSAHLDTLNLISDLSSKLTGYVSRRTTTKTSRSGTICEGFGSFHRIKQVCRVDRISCKKGSVRCRLICAPSNTRRRKAKKGNLYFRGANP
jgi:hypothetical protein